MVLVPRQTAGNRPHLSYSPYGNVENPELEIQGEVNDDYNRTQYSPLMVEQYK